MRLPNCQQESSHGRDEVDRSWRPPHRIDGIAEAWAQQIPGCTSAVQANPPRTVFRCTGGLTIEAEGVRRVRSFGITAGRSHLIDPTQEPRHPDRADPAPSFSNPDTTRDRFGARHDLRGGRHSCTDIGIRGPGGTRVTRREQSEAVNLGRGQGVDVTPDNPLVVRRWPLEREPRRCSDALAGNIWRG